MLGKKIIGEHWMKIIIVTEECGFVFIVFIVLISLYWIKDRQSYNTCAGFLV